MSDTSDNPTPAVPIQRRRSSIAEIFRPQLSPHNSSTSIPPAANITPSLPSPPNHRRGMSVALGLNTSNSQPSPYAAFARQRRASFATTGSTSPGLRSSFDDERAVIDEEDAAVRPPMNTPASPSFGRRLSFGAQAFRDMKQGGSSGSPGSGRHPSNLSTLNENNENKRPTHTHRPSVSAKVGGEGFNWSEALREKSKRAPSFSSGSPLAGNSNRSRTVSSAAAEPPKELPKAEPVPVPLRQRKPDHLGERMLRGDFMMD